MRKIYFLSGTLLLTGIVSLFAQNELTGKKVSDLLSLKTETVQSSNSPVDISNILPNEGETGENAKKTHRIKGTEPYSLPFLDTFDSDIDGYTVVDSNNDNCSWEWNEEGNSVARYQHSEVNPADDWLITPNLKMQAGRTYKVSVAVSASLTRYAERLEVKWGQGKTAEVMVNELIPSTDIQGKYYRRLEGQFKPTEDGVFNIGLHAISDANMARLWVDSLSIEQIPELNAPDSVTNLKAVADAKALLKSTLTFTAPVKAIDGSAITALDSIEVRNNNVLVATLRDVVPGQEYSCIDNKAMHGPDNAYTITAFNENGPGRALEKKLFVGLDVPTMPVVTAADLGNAVKLTWSGVKGANGGVVVPEEVIYKVFNFSSYYLDLITELTGENTYTIPDININDGDTQAIRYWTVQACNEEGASNNAMAYLITGKPYTIPYNLSFKNGTLEDQFVLQAHNSNFYKWGASTFDCQDDDNGCLALTCSAPTIGNFQTGKIMLDPTHKSKLQFYYRAIGDIPGVFYVTIHHKDGTVDAPVFHKDLTENTDSEWQRVLVDMPEATCDDDYVTIFFNADLTAALNGSNLFLDNISIFNDIDNDASVTISAPDSLVLGENANIMAEVMNVGANDLTDAHLQIFVNDALMADSTFTKPIATLHKVQMPIVFRTSSLHATDLFNVSAVVSSEKDQNADNNKADFKIEAMQADVEAPSNLEVLNYNPVELKWTAPASKTVKVAEDFDSYDAWSTELGEWTMVDADHGYAGALSGYFSYPHQTEQFAFMTWRPSDYFSAGQGLEPHSGDIDLVAVYQRDADQKNYVGADNWLISPLLSGNKQTISIWVNNHRSGQFGSETFQILTSTTDKNIESFTTLGSDYSQPDGQWREITFDVPEGTRYFALRHTTKAGTAHLFMIDDITYEGTTAPEAYNVYRDGELIATVYEPEYTDNIPDPNGTYQYDVTAVYNHGYESKPIEQVATGVIETLEQSEDVFNVYTVDGVQILKNATTLRGLQPGMYIINGKKIILRK